MFQQKNLVKIYIVLCLFVSSLQLIAMSRYAKPMSSRTKSIQEASKESATQALKAQRSKQCYDLVMLIDDVNTDTNQAISDTFLAALAQKNFPIIVSTRIVYTVCNQVMSYNSINPLAILTGPSKKQKLLLDLINLTGTDWYCYDHPGSEIMLFIPKNYIKQFVEVLDKDIAEKMKDCGFDITHLTRIDIFSPETLMVHVKEKSSKVKKISAVQAIESMFHIPDKSNLPTWNIYLIGHGHAKRDIAGLELNDFLQLLACFQKINCSFLYYVSCYSGGYNQNIVKEELSKLKVNFIVGAQGISEEVTLLGVDNTTALSNFFKKAELFFGNPVAFVKNSHSDLWNRDPLGSIVKTVVKTGTLDFSQPFIYLPSVGVFNALTIDKSVKIVTKSMVKAYEFENKTLDFTDSAIETIIIYPDYIRVPMKIKGHVAIASPTRPDDINMHIFEDLIYEDSLSSMIPNFMTFNEKFSTMIFAIKKLHCFDYKYSSLGNDYENLISIENMLIQFNVYEKDMDLYIKVSVLFDYDKQTYALQNSFSIPRSKNVSKVIFEEFRDIPMQKRSGNGDILYDFANAELQNYLKNKQLLPSVSTTRTLADVIDILKSTIDTTTRVQELGALQKVLLQKQQQILREQKSPEISLKKNIRQVEKLSTSLASPNKELFDISNKTKEDVASDVSKTPIGQQSWTSFFTDKINQSYNTIAERVRSLFRRKDPDKKQR